jgi:HTH-type transcriptional regulator/antitoxin HigA
MFKPIKTKQVCDIALERVYYLMQKNIAPNSKESNELEILSILIKEFESKAYKLSNKSRS